MYITISFVRVVNTFLLAIFLTDAMNIIDFIRRCGICILLLCRRHQQHLVCSPAHSASVPLKVGSVDLVPVAHGTPRRRTAPHQEGKEFLLFS